MRTATPLGASATTAGKEKSGQVHPKRTNVALDSDVPTV